MRYSTFAVRLFSNVMSTPSRGENASLMLTLDTLNMLLGVGAPVVVSLTKPSPFIYSWKVL